MTESATMDGKICLVTGATNGIGKETALALAQMGATVLITARDDTKGAAARDEIEQSSGNERVELFHADFTSLDETRRLASEVQEQHPHLHVLVNNAGAYNAQRSLTRDGFETTFGVNHLAYFLLTTLLLDQLKASAPARIVNVSSAAHARAKIDFDDLHGERKYAGMTAYGQSKLANVLFTYELARRLEGTGVTANAVHPGVVLTGFGRNSTGLAGAAFAIYGIVGRPFTLTPKQGAETSIYLASSPDVDGVTGKYFTKKASVETSPLSYDTDVAQRLWQVSEELVSGSSNAAS